MKHRMLRTFAVVLMIASSMPVAHALDPALDFSATPGLPCRPGDKPETIQGRVPAADVESGRAAEGYYCNATEISHYGSDGEGTASNGGYRVYRYVDTNGHVCAIYDTTLLWPLNAAAAGSELTGVWILDMTDPANPVRTATLSSLAMMSPHESLSFNAERGLLGAVWSNPAFYPGQFDLYDLSEDCRHPVLKASTPMGILGHEGSFTPDGLTYYASSLYGHTLVAVDVANPLAPVLLWQSAKWNVHGMNTSEDGKTLYFADVARNGANSLELAGSETKGLTILDVSQIQDRVLNPQVSVISHLTWPNVGTPQTDLPISIGGRKYLVEIDEFGGGDNVGAGRIIDVEDSAAPKVVSNLRLAVNNAEHRTNGSLNDDPGADNSLGGYRGHYCGVPSYENPKIVACTFILSGLRVFDIRDPQRPVEIAYFNKPSMSGDPRGPQGAYAMSQPAFDVEARQIWYSDGNSGFYNVQVDESVWPL